MTIYPTAITLSTQTLGQEAHEPDQDARPANARTDEQVHNAALEILQQAQAHAETSVNQAPTKKTTIENSLTCLGPCLLCAPHPSCTIS